MGAWTMVRVRRAVARKRAAATRVQACWRGYTVRVALVDAPDMIAHH